MKTAKELQKIINGLQLESARKTMTIQNKDKEIETFIKKYEEMLDAWSLDKEEINKLWQKRFEWLFLELSSIDSIQYNREWVHILIREAQNKEFEE